MPLMDLGPLTAEDGHRIAAKMCMPEGTPRGLVQISHGMAEHQARYGRVADALAAQGWAVVTHDHRGHGASAPIERDLGHFADEDGWRKVRADLQQVRAAGRERAPDGPVVLLGHSMGSFIALSEQIHEGGNVDRLVLSGSNVGGGPLVSAGLVAAKAERLRQGKRGKSKVLAFLSFGSFNKGFEGRTEFDWLSRDEAEVDKYVADPWCGFDCTNQLWVDLLEALADNGRAERLRRIPSDLPVYILSGDRDPVSQGGKGVRALEKQLRAVGIRDLTTQLYRDARHELFNETNRDEVLADLTEWLAK
ncbi:MAG: alpha/beta hydrolase [Sandaracinaceae bacterium]